ncbi:hypothetical protein [Streptomyces sp. MMBL 11-3]|uniref:hypothetical protein n=1 Tax=Streptomyces sp. MMBL 11-3 TaxID=3382639 RepID=UPI0039B3E26A
MKSAPFSLELVQLQAAFNRTYAALAAPASYPAGAVELRRRLLVLSVRLRWHPFWTGPGPGRGAAARVQLRRQVRAQEGAAQW